MIKLISNGSAAPTETSEKRIPLMRAAAAISFAIAPCSLGFVMIAVCEQSIRSIMVGDDPEMLVSELQNRFPTAAIKVDDDNAGLAATVVSLIDNHSMQV